MRTQLLPVFVAFLVVSCSDAETPQADASTTRADAGLEHDAGAHVGADGGGGDAGELDATPVDVAAHDAGVAADGGEADAGGVGCPVTRRCARRVVEVCVPATGAFEEDHVCDRTQRCVGGVCEALPPVYGAPCRSAQESAACAAEGFVCGGPAVVPFCIHAEAPVAAGGECYGSRDCERGLLCTLDGRCSAGAVGDACRDDDDCTGNLTCTGSGTCG